MNRFKFSDLKVIHRIALLVVLGISMSVILLTVNEVANRIQASNQRLLYQLEEVQLNLLKAVGAEQRFLAHTKEEDKQEVISFAREGLELVDGLSDSSLDQEEVNALNSQLGSYLTAFAGTSDLVIAAKEDDVAFREQLNKMDSLVKNMLNSIRDYVGKQALNAEEADKTVVSLADVIRNIDLLMTRRYMTLQNEVFLESDVEAFRSFSESNATEIDKRLRNLRVISKVLERKDFNEYSQQGSSLYEMASPMVEATVQLADQWENRIHEYEALNEKRNTVLARTSQLVHSETASSERFLFRLKLIQYAIVLVLGAVFVFFSYRLARSITEPLARVIDFAQTIRKGDLSLRIEQQSKDELGQLAESFNDMADGLQQKATFAAAVAEGDLSQHVDLASTEDSLGQALDKMVDDLNTLLSQVQDAVDQVTGGAGQLSDASQALSQGATEQAASLEEITSSVTELASQTKANAENARQANELSGDARQAAENGNEKMGQLISAMNDINGSSGEISKIIKAIDEIAFQTNLLALNAAVEAARAGVHGKGFAVVAEEVRNLASRSAQAAHETAELIDTSVKKTENGSRIVNETAEALVQIVEKIARATDLVGEIAAASNEQALGIEQINKGLTQVDQVTQQNSANAEQTASTATVLTKQARQLGELIARFKLAESSQTNLQQQNLLSHTEASDWSNTYDAEAEDHFEYK